LVEEVLPYAGKTGGTFCVGYLAERDGNRAFVKVVDFIAAMHNRPDAIVAIQEASSVVIAERAVLELCRDRRLTRVIRMVDAGDYEAPQFAGQLLGKVFYFVFEPAESDVRKEISLNADAGILWKLRVLKDVAIGIQQLDQIGVAHQDIKPSNVLLMERPEDGGDHKLGDLGRAVRVDVTGPVDDLVFPGDLLYAPLSAWYGIREPEWVDGRTAGDLYMLGVLACFLFAQVNLTQLQLNLLKPELKRPAWTGTFQDVLPFLIDVHAKALELVEDSFPEPYKVELVSLVRELTNPNPLKRGDPRARARVGRPPGTEVYVSKFSALVKRAELRDKDG